MQNIMLNHADKGVNGNKLRAFSGNWNVGRARMRVCVFICNKQAKSQSVVGDTSSKM